VVASRGITVGSVGSYRALLTGENGAGELPTPDQDPKELQAVVEHEGVRGRAGTQDPDGRS
jgi:hypothetical protein